MLSIREIAARHQPASLAAAKRLLKEAGQATVAEVWAAYQASPAPEARFAILYAARRARHAA